MKQYLTLSKILFLAVLTLIVTSCNTYVNISLDNLTKGSWTELSSPNGTSPIPRHEAAFIAVDDKIYLLGGREIKPVSVYHTDDNRWTQGAAPPIELHHFQPVVYEDEIWIIGAMTGGYPGETPVEEIYVYNPKDDSWRIEGKISKERARGGAGVAIVDDHLYIVCGIKDGHRGDHKNWLDRYDIKKKKWNILPDAPRARDHFQVAFLRGQLYVIGGRTTISSDNPFKHTMGQIDVYHLDDQTWSTPDTELPTWRAGTSVSVIEDEILVFGGESFTQVSAHSEVEAYNVISKKWRSLPDIPQGRHGTGLVYQHGKLYTASGCGERGGQPELTDVWVYEY